MRVTPDCDTINSFYIYYDGPTPVQNSPDITFGGGNYFVIWGDGRSLNYQIYGTRVTPAGSVLDPGGILLSRNPNANYSYPSADWGALGISSFMVIMHLRLLFYTEDLSIQMAVLQVIQSDWQPPTALFITPM
ncbi:MAG: hypothetical protein ABIL66_08445 [candidate division WOR-3 bacterium]